MSSFNSNNHSTWTKDMPRDFPDEEIGNDKYNSDPDNNDSPKERNILKNMFKKQKCLIVLTLGGILTLLIIVLSSITAIHRVDQGNIGVYFRNGALLNQITDPGIHWMQPFFTTVLQISVIPKTKTLRPMTCITRDGVKNIFRDTRVISSIERNMAIEFVRNFSVNFEKILLYDHVSESLHNFCANHSIDEVYSTKFLDIRDYVNQSLHEHLMKFAPQGIKVWNLFLPKPEVPPAIASNYRKVKVEWTQQLVAQEKQKTDIIKRNTEKLKSLIKAETEKEVQKIEIAKEIEKEEGKRNVTRVASEIWREKERINADTSTYVKESEAKSNQLLLTDQYIKLQFIKSLANTTKMYLPGADYLFKQFMGKLFEENI